MRFLRVLWVLSVFLQHFWLAGWVELLRFFDLVLFVGHGFLKKIISKNSYMEGLAEAAELPEPKTFNVNVFS